MISLPRIERRIQSLLGTTLTKLDEIKVGDKPAVGVKVSAKGHKDFKLFFDKSSGLPVKKVRICLDVEGSQEELSEALYADYKDFDGIKFPTKVTFSRDGKKRTEWELLEVKLLDKVDPAEFEKPK